MKGSAKTFRVFVSSTFSDLKAERDALQARVFPRLRDLCERHGARFQAIDLRWGVSQQASQDQQTMNICLREIDRCQEVTPRPNFIVLLGDRYGWCPPPPQIPADEFKSILSAVSKEERKLLVWVEESQPSGGDMEMVRWDSEGDAFVGDRGWYRRDENAVPPEYVLQPWEGYSYEAWGEIEAKLQEVLERGAKSAGLSEEAQFKYGSSATHQEIAAGALSPKAEPEHVFAFFREIDGLPQNDEAEGFLDLVGEEDGKKADPLAGEKQEALKEELRSELGDNVEEYEARWTKGIL